MSNKTYETVNSEVSIYGENIERMNQVMLDLTDIIKNGALLIKERTGMDAVEHLKFRVKSEESIREKCRRMGLPETTESALEEIRDAIGLRVICPFLDDIYAIREIIASRQDLEIITEKDYIKNVKPNGYRSYHMIVRYGGYYAEIQIRTISMDTWAALEHHMRYKKEIKGNEALIQSELKRCADEFASTDASMQTIRAMINGEV